MSGWRPATQRPRRAQRVVALHSDKSIGLMCGEIRYGDLLSDSGGRWGWFHFVSWIPERELIKQARAAGKGAK